MPEHKRKVVRNNHYTLVIAKSMFGLRRNVRLVANYGNNFQEVVMTTQRYATVDNAKRSASVLSENLGIPVVVEN